MDALFNKKVKSLIKDTLLVNKTTVNESFSAQTKKFSIQTDYLSQGNINNHFDLYENYIENYNLASIKLDSADRINMDTLSYMRLARDFGTFDAWQKDFIACAQSSQCGWAVTYLNMYTQSYMNCFIDLHTNNVPAGMYPIVVVDMWQHAYYKDYLKDSKTYLIAMMKQLRWPVIEKRIEKADKIIQVLRS